MCKNIVKGKGTSYELQMKVTRDRLKALFEADSEHGDWRRIMDQITQAYEEHDEDRLEDLI